jgi:hypothetical protein
MNIYPWKTAACDPVSIGCLLWKSSIYVKEVFLNQGGVYYYKKKYEH